MKHRLLSPVPMKRVEILALDRHLRKLTWALGELGVLHLTAAPYTPATAELQERDRTEELALCREIISEIGLLCDQIGTDSSAPGAPSAYVPLQHIRQKVDEIRQEAQKHLDERDRLESHLAELKQMVGEIEPIRRLGVPLQSLKGLSFVHFASGQISERELPSLESEIASSALIIPMDDSANNRGNRTVIAVSSRKGRFALDSALEKHRFAPEEITGRYEGIPAEVADKLTGELDAQSLELGKVNLIISGLGERHQQDLLSWRARAGNEIDVIHAQNKFSRTHNTALINGWVPEERIADLQRTVLDETDGMAVIEVTDPDKDADDVPTEIRHSAWLQPFTLLVKAYGFPGYREIEPTLMVAISFMVMFGVMFGDVGHGLILLIVGLVLRSRMTEDALKDFAGIIAYSGVASMAFGMVYASVFGIPAIEERFALIHPMDPHHMLPFIAGTVGIGVVLICVGLLINIINRLRKGDYYNGVLGRTGIVGAIFYTGALGLGIRAVVVGEGHGVQTWHVVMLVLVPLLIIFLREPIWALLTRKNKLFHEGAFGGLMEAGVEVMETVSSFISNTASFARVGAFALSHAGLCVAIFELVKIVQDAPGGSILTVLVLIFGNALVICLEAMVVGIQVMRLEYYEFFTKFFTGEGKAYQPFHISNRTTKERS